MSGVQTSIAVFLLTMAALMIPGTVIVSSLATGNGGYAPALVVQAVFASEGLAAPFLLPDGPMAGEPEPALRTREG